VQGTFRVSDGRIVLWDDHFSHLRLIGSLVRNLVR
jgi:limonene-1,2-epoxide hydrolase